MGDNFVPSSTSFSYYTISTDNVGMYHSKVQ